MNQTKAALTRATLKILKPLVRMLLRNGMSHGEFSEIARQAFVDVGFNDFKIEDQKQTTSRVSVLTGLSRKEVVRLNKKLPDPRVISKMVPINRATRVISGWLRDPEFLNSKKRPLDLPRYGETSSFAVLVARYSGDITAGAILDELIRVRAVVHKKELIHLCNEAYIPQAGKEEKLKIMGISGSDLLETIDHNLNCEKDKSRFQRQVVYSYLSPTIVEEFKELSEKKSNELLLELNQWLAAKKLHSIPPEGSELNIRAGMGIYFIENEIKEE